MGLHSYVRKLSKSKLLEAYSSPRFGMALRFPHNGVDLTIPPRELIKVPIGQPLQSTRGYWDMRNELGYWSDWHELHELMLNIAMDKVPTTPDLAATVTAKAAPMILNEEDVERMRFEALFGGIFSDRRTQALGEKTKKLLLNEFMSILDRMRRVIRRNASIVFYVGN